MAADLSMMSGYGRQSKIGKVHNPVLKDEILEYLTPALKSGGVFVDATVGAGGHAQVILEQNSKCWSIGIDRDKETLKVARKNLREFGDRVKLVYGNFVDLAMIVQDLETHFHRDGGERRWNNIKAILFDLGVSSMQFDQADRGFSFRQDGPLDMRMDRLQLKRAADIVNQWPVSRLEQILRDYGEERQFKKIARAVVEARCQHRIETTGELVEIVEKALNICYGGRGMKIHPATRTFQALRIAVNNELENLSIALPQAVDLLTAGGRIAVVSFHSLEDRIVKNVFRSLARDCTCPIEQPECTCGRQNAKVKILTKKPVVPSSEEIFFNPRSRSAKLRVAEKLVF